MTRLRRCTILLMCLSAGAGASVAPAQAASRRLGDRVLSLGSHGSDVKSLQKLLSKAGFTATPDGDFGRGTRTAVRRFQKVAALGVTGVADRPTVVTLKASVATTTAAPATSAGGPDGGAGFGSATMTGDTGTAAAATPATSAPATTTPPASGPTGQATLAADGVTAVAPAGAPAVIVAIIAAANRIATTPYRYGGGHASFDDTAYDCSGSVSYALHGGGLLDTTMVSGDLAKWGDAGPGRWVTIYANDEHVYMYVAGLRFDTSGQRTTGSRWQTAPRSNAGFTVRHPTGW